MAKNRILAAFSVFDVETGGKRKIYASKKKDDSRKMPKYHFSWSVKGELHDVLYRANNYENAKKRFKKDLKTFNLKYGWDTGVK